MFDNFPYSDMHQLNLDWIIKIAKDFLDQYTQIQNTISQGLEDLDTKAENLQQLLQEWYDTHSQDIANQLADALQDLNEWYTQHQNYLDQTLADNIAEFNSAADDKAATTIASIPADYTVVSRGGDACLTSWNPIRYENQKLISRFPIYLHINSLQIHRDISTLVNGFYEVEIGLLNQSNPFIIYSVSQQILSAASISALNGGSRDDFILVASLGAEGIVGHQYKGNSFLSSASTIYWEGSTIWSYNPIKLVSSDLMTTKSLGSFNSTNNRYEITGVGTQGVENILIYSDSLNILSVASDTSAFNNPDWTIVQAPVHTGIIPFNDTYGLQKAITFGTSITWYDGHPYNNGPEEGVICKGYQHYLRSMLNMIITNEGTDGASMPRICQQVLTHSNFNDYDYIFIEGGANDQRKGTPMGVTVPTRNSITGESSTIDKTTFKGALQYILEYIFYKKPTAKVFILTPLQGYLRAGSYQSSPEGIIDPKWAEAMKEVASLYSVPVIDLYNESWISPANISTFYNDPLTESNKEYLHPSTIGYKRMGEIIIAHMKALM